MSTTTKDTISLLNDLVQINNDRIEGYEKASQETNDSQLKSIFSNLAQESKKFKEELSREIIAAGGKPVEGTTTSGKFYRIWMDIKAAFAGKDRKAIIASCEFGEDAALGEYHSVLKSDDLSPNYRDLITRQEIVLKQAHDKIKFLRDSANVN